MSEEHYFKVGDQVRNLFTRRHGEITEIITRYAVRYGDDPNCSAIPFGDRADELEPAPPPTEEEKLQARVTELEAQVSKLSQDQRPWPIGTKAVRQSSKMEECEVIVCGASSEWVKIRFTSPHPWNDTMWERYSNLKRV